jgi:hypothetical protein
LSAGRGSAHGASFTESEYSPRLNNSFHQLLSDLRPYLPNIGADAASNPIPCPRWGIPRWRSKLQKRLCHSGCRDLGYLRHLFFEFAHKPPRRQFWSRELANSYNPSKRYGRYRRYRKVLYYKAFLSPYLPDTSRKVGGRYLPLLEGKVRVVSRWLRWLWCVSPRLGLIPFNILLQLGIEQLPALI